MSHTTLSRVNISHEGKVLQELCRLLFYESPGEKDRKIVIKVQAEKDKRNIVENPSERDRK